MTLPGSPQTRNPFLSRVASELRRGRPAYPVDRPATVHREVVGGRPFVRLWFLSPGCTHDRRGHCTMCNYGLGVGVRWDTVVDAVADELGALRGTSGTLLLSPSGSMFDEREVPPDVRRALFGMAAETDFETVLSESRPESLSEDVIDETTTILGGKLLALELGLESSDPWILRWCVNKGLDLARMTNVVAVAGRRGVSTTLNVSLGTAFLTAGEAIADAVATARWGLTAGASDVVLFPLLVRGWTVLDHFHRHGRHEAPSLWSLVETLRQLGPELAPRVSIAWYRDYSDREGEAAASMAVRARPGTCPSCEDHVLAQLDLYRDTQSFEVIASLSQHGCGCRTNWVANVAASPTESLVERVRSGYADLGREVLGEGWWQRHGERVLSEVNRL